MKEFTTAANAVAEQKQPSKGLEFMVDGETLIAHKPREGQVAVLMATVGRHATEQDMVAGIINFFASTLDKNSYGYIERRLLDYDDEFGIEQVQDILEWLIEEWTGRPTKLPSGSTPSPESTGHESTAQVPAST